MCDFSLGLADTRLAVDGEQLFIHEFDTQLKSKGLASRADFLAARPGILKQIANFLLRPGKKIHLDLPAVCIPPGARLTVSGIPKWIQQKYGIGAIEEATFTQITYEPFRYRDAFRFSNGRTLSLQKFREGVRVEVVRVALEEEPDCAPVETNTGMRFDAIPQRR